MGRRNKHRGGRKKREKIRLKQLQIEAIFQAIEENFDITVSRLRTSPLPPELFSNPGGAISPTLPFDEDTTPLAVFRTLTLNREGPEEPPDDPESDPPVQNIEVITINDEDVGDFVIQDLENHNPTSQLIPVSPPDVNAESVIQISIDCLEPLSPNGNF